MGKKYPFYKKISIQKESWFPFYQYISRENTHHALLESGRGGRYSVMGLDPVAILKGKNNILEISNLGKTTTQTGNPLLLMRDWMKEAQIETNLSLPFFQGGAIGFLSYDYARYIEKLPQSSIDDLDVPDLFFMIFDDVFVFDHQEEMLYIIVCMEKNEQSDAEERLLYLQKVWETTTISNEGKDEASTLTPTVADELQVSLTEPQFGQAVKKIKEYISAGDVFQVNLSVRQAQALLVNAIDVYSVLREINPSPYMAYMHTPDFQIVSGSPELLIQKDGDQVSTRPIAGTRSRGKDEMEDEKLARELIDNEKERAEHVMLVDLERNDLGRVCQYGTVQVDEFMVIERYSHVMHIVSNVKGTLLNRYDAYDVINAVFPGGTITGAPKIRTMEIIEELEPVRRGIYTGSIGWIGYNGDMCLNISIRTMMVMEGIAYIQAGAGVVIDSNPDFEYKESLKKAKALWQAKEVAEEKENRQKVAE
ncbi:anthranilate synthase component I family protein [Bacillus sp. DJP31]|uniref:anthranilate synthase component I family protein n=1 Tax=Bacillus sp. DJP31 TaxID=3409789 RepID=UPI003BB61DC0